MVKFFFTFVFMVFVYFPFVFFTPLKKGQFGLLGHRNPAYMLWQSCKNIG